MLDSSSLQKTFLNYHLPIQNISYIRSSQILSIIHTSSTGFLELTKYHPTPGIFLTMTSRSLSQTTLPGDVCVAGSLTSPGLRSEGTSTKRPPLTFLTHRLLTLSLPYTLYVSTSHLPLVGMLYIPLLSAFLHQNVDPWRQNLCCGHCCNLSSKNRVWCL